MNKFLFTFWISNGRRRIVKKLEISAKYKRDAQANAKQIIRDATPAGYVSVNISEIERCRLEHCKMIGTSERIPVIVHTQRVNAMYFIGVQFWTPLMLTVGRCTNSDGSTSIFLDYVNTADVTRTVTV